MNRTLKKKIINPLIGFLAHGVFFILRRLGIENAANMTGWVTRKIGPLLSAHKVGLRNLEMVFPSNTPEENEQILQECWNNIGRVVGELPNLDKLTMEGANPRVTSENREVIDALVRNKQQAVIFTAHYGCWEAIPWGGSSAGLDQTIIYRKANNKYVDELIQKFRERKHVEFAPKGAKGVRMIYKALKEGRTLGFLVDQKMDNGMEVPFFGKPSMCPHWAAEFAIKNNLPMIPVYCIRHPRSYFTIVIENPIYPELSGDLQKDVYNLMLRVNVRMEEWIKERPGHWFWLHRRWSKDQYK